MLLIKSFTQTLKLSWIKKILDPNNNSSWKILLSDILENYGYENTWHLQKEGLDIMSKSFNHLGKMWNKLRGKFQTFSAIDTKTVLSQPLWYNKKIKTDDQSIFKKKRGKIGNIFINNLIAHRGIFF